MKIKRFKEDKDNSNETLSEARAQEFMGEYQTWFDDEAGDMVISTQDCKELMIEFAKLHVEAALKAASENGEVNTEPDYLGGEWSIINTDSILNSYPLENIK